GVLVAVQSSPAGGLAPDGFHVEGSSWRVTYAVPGGDEYSYAVSSDRITVERTPSTADCVPGDEISVEGLTRKIQEATVLLETRFGVVYEPGTFSLNAGRSAASVSPAEQRQTLVHSQSQLPTSANHTVEFNELWPDGIICDLDLLGCE
ncbi:MAG TPA: hypothetical protein VKZ49_14265, partial [Polyangiaceae bacterium]|nr:hypothetical protein [Polyangiaceae bacterium]